MTTTNVSNRGITLKSFQKLDIIPMCITGPDNDNLIYDARSRMTTASNSICVVQLDFIKLNTPLCCTLNALQKQ